MLVDTWTSVEKESRVFLEIHQSGEMMIKIQMRPIWTMMSPNQRTKGRRLAELGVLPVERRNHGSECKGSGQSLSRTMSRCRLTQSCDLQQPVRQGHLYR